MDYLKWYRQVLNIPVENDCKLKRIEPILDNEFALEFERFGQSFIIKAHKVILATGRAGLEELLSLVA